MSTAGRRCVESGLAKQRDIARCNVATVCGRRVVSVACSLLNGWCGCCIVHCSVVRRWPCRTAGRAIARCPPAAPRTRVYRVCTACVPRAPGCRWSRQSACLTCTPPSTRRPGARLVRRESPASPTRSPAERSPLWVSCSEALRCVALDSRPVAGACAIACMRFRKRGGPPAAMRCAAQAAVCRSVRQGGVDCGRADRRRKHLVSGTALRPPARQQ